MLKKLLILLSSMSLAGCSVNVNRATPPVDVPVPEVSGVYAKAIPLANGQTVVVTEGRLEPRSIGSMTVKLYRDIVVGDFVEAISFSRDGTIIKAVLIENGEDKQKLAITTATAGSGNYQMSQLVCIEANTLKAC